MSVIGESVAPLGAYDVVFVIPLKNDGLTLAAVAVEEEKDIILSTVLVTFCCLHGFSVFFARDARFIVPARVRASVRRVLFLFFDTHLWYGFIGQANPPRKRERKRHKTSYRTPRKEKKTIKKHKKKKNTPTPTRVWSCTNTVPSSSPWYASASNLCSYRLTKQHIQKAEDIETITKTVLDVKNVTDANAHQLAFATGGLWALMIVFASAMGLIYFLYVSTRMKRDDEGSDDEKEEDEREDAAAAHKSDSSSSSDEETETAIGSVNANESGTAPAGDQQPPPQSSQTDKEKKDN